MTDSSAASPAPIPWRERARAHLEEIREGLKKQIETEAGKIERENEDNPHWYPPRPVWYWMSSITYLGLQIAGAVLALTHWHAEPVHVLGQPVNWALCLLLLQGLHLALSLRTVRVDQLVGISFFGRPLYPPLSKPAISGPHVVVFGLMTFLSAERNYQDRRFPGPADKIFRISTDVQKTREGGDAPPEGFVRPFIALTGEPRLTKEEREHRTRGGEYNPLDEQLPVEVSYSTRFRPSERFGGLFRIARNLSVRFGDITERILDLIHEQADRDMQEVLSLVTIATLQDNRGLANEIFVLTLRLHVMRLGIDIDDTGNAIVDVNPSHDTNLAQMRIARAKMDKQSAIIAAEAEKQKRTLLGQGDASAIRAGLEAKAAGYKQIMKTTEVSGLVVIASETAEQALGEKTVILGSEGLAQILGLGQLLLKGLPENGKSAISGTDTSQQGGTNG